MAIPSSGPISFRALSNEFGDTGSVSLSEFLRGGSLVPDFSGNSNVPTTANDVDMSDYRGSYDFFEVTLNVLTTQELNLDTYATANGWDGLQPIALTLNTGRWLWSNSTGAPALLIPATVPYCLLFNYGNIIGKGGVGNGGAGGPAIRDYSGNLHIANQSGAYIAGGGGGGGGGAYTSGGGGAGGGAGGGPTGNDGYGSFNGGAGGAVGQSGSNGAGVGSYFGYGGGSGGGGGTTVDRGSKKDNPSGAGGGGGRVLPGTGGVGPRNAGNGGSAGGTGSSTAGGNWHAGGGGGWGASGGAGTNGSGGAGGRAVTWSSTQGTVTNSGTIYGGYL